VKIPILLKNRAWIEEQHVPTSLLHAYYYTIKHWAKEDPEDWESPWVEIDKGIDLVKDGSKNRIGLPRGDLKKITSVLRSPRYELKDQRSIFPLGFDFRLHDYISEDDRYPAQLKLLTKWLSAGGGVIQAPAASGKSIIGIMATQATKLRTLCLFDRKDFLFQWRKEFCKHTNIEQIAQETGAELLGVNERDRCYPITFSTFQSLQTARGKDFCRQHRDSFGLIIVDECHHLPAKTYREAVMSFNPLLFLGVTATPVRKDGLEGVLHDILGPLAAVGGAEQLNPIVFVHRTKAEVKTHGRMPDFAQWGYFLNQLAKDKQRNKLIAENIVKDYQDNRCILAVSERVNHLRTMKDLLAKEIDPEKIVIVEGNTPDRERVYGDVEAGRYDVLLASKVIDEGVNITRLDTLHILTPFGSKGARCEQRVGRIRRKHPNKKRPLVRDYLDASNGRLYGAAKGRLNVYNNIGAEVLDARTKMILKKGFGY
jgi:superfamily II DNA or RNA helicase